MLTLIVYLNNMLDKQELKLTETLDNLIAYYNGSALWVYSDEIRIRETIILPINYIGVSKCNYISIINRIKNFMLIQLYAYTY
jgi:hypothetical protein